MRGSYEFTVQGTYKQIFIESCYRLYNKTTFYFKYFIEI